MALRLVTEPADGTIPVGELRELQVAEVVQHPNAIYVGHVIIRLYDSIFGLSLREVWSRGSILGDERLRVRVLADGEQLVVADNE